jgi:hypothetical protein
MRIHRNTCFTATLVFVAGLTVAASSGAQTAAPSPSARTVDLTTLRLLLQKGVISEAEYDSALRDLSESVGAKGGDSNSLVIGKWSATLYGFAEADYIVDSTQSYSDLAGNAQVAHPGSYAATHPRMQVGVRNSRFGFLFRAPEYHSMRASAVVEADFLGDWSSIAYNSTTGQPTENQYFTNPTLRLRHAYMKIENPIVDVLFGQTWHLFGWQNLYHPNTVQIQGTPGELYSRTPQVRLSKTFSNKDVTFDIAVGAMRPPQRDSAIPEGEAGLHFALNRWTGVQTLGSTGTVVSPASIAVTGDLRGYAVANYPTGGTVAAPSLKSTTNVNKTGDGIAVDAFLPVIPGSKEHMGNSLSLLGEFVYGQGIGDLYTGLSSGLGFPALVPVPAGSPAGTVSTTAYNPQIDSGLVTVSSTGAVSTINWRTVRAGLQYTLPGLDGRMWLSGNYANVTSPNAPGLVTTTAATATAKATSNASSIRDALNWFDVCVMGDLTPAVRLGLEYAYSTDKYADGQSGVDHRVQASAYYMF